MRGRLALAVLAAGALTLGACSEGGREEPDAGTDTPGYTIAFITHETPGDTFSDKVRAGAEQAAADTGVDLKYSNDPDAGKQAVLIQGAVDSKVQGIATTLVTPDALVGAVKAATGAGIPVVGLNAGIDNGKLPPDGESIVAEAKANVPGFGVGIGGELNNCGEVTPLGSVDLIALNVNVMDGTLQVEPPVMNASAQIKVAAKVCRRLG